MFSFFKNRKARKKAQGILLKEAIEKITSASKLITVKPFSTEEEGYMKRTYLQPAEELLISAKLASYEYLAIYENFCRPSKVCGSLGGYVMYDFGKKILALAIK
jgi:hypothetical protein